MLVRESCAPMKFVYVSGGRDFGDEAEDSTVAANLAPLDGYSQSKFVAEVLVKHSAQQKMKTNHRLSIIKPGLIIGTADEGIANIDDFMWRLAAGAASIKSYPEPDIGDWLCVSSAERVAGALIDSFLQPAEEIHRDASSNTSSSIITTISDGITMSDFWTILNAKLNHQLQPLPFRDWLELLRKDVESQKETHPVWPVFHVLEREGKIGSKRAATAAALKAEESEADAKASEAVKAAVAKNVDFLIEIGFLARAGADADGKSNNKMTNGRCEEGDDSNGSGSSRFDLAFKRR